MTHEFFKTGKIQLQLEKLKMNVYSSISLSNDVYESCLRYTILAHIAPQWNKVGEYLVQGRNFLDNESPMNAVKMDIGMKNNEMFLVLWPARVRFNKMDFQDLDVSSKMKEQVLSDKSGEKIQMHIGDQMIHVLPRQVYCISIWVYHK
ncbi:uncharacterized protein C18orf63-like [Bacillus rossius redtenbacheri]|uniref:uncharacterized protein C18orf63-like n=1 Tax=Bacillus rossius redtenbacheri TaxID=93214 RepID=UPI002FDDCD5A